VINHACNSTSLPSVGEMFSNPELKIYRRAESNPELNTILYQADPVHILS
jgi:hypothetical protein